jgi:hypothetical protein
MTNGYPPVQLATQLGDQKRLFIGAYGFEKRSLGWLRHQLNPSLTTAIVFNYKHPKGKNKIAELRRELTRLGAKRHRDLECDVRFPYPIEDVLDVEFKDLGYDEVVLDITAMTKLLILACLCKLSQFSRSVRVVYSEARNYSPNRQQFDAAVKKGMAVLTKFPSRGAESIVRLRCLSSIRMQGQPVTLVAFTSFNEHLVSHML